jgi:hypothetical protein
MPEVKHPGNLSRKREKTRDWTRKEMMTPDDYDDDGKVMIIVVAVGTGSPFLLIVPPFYASIDVLFPLPPSTASNFVECETRYLVNKKRESRKKKCKKDIGRN